MSILGVCEVERIPIASTITPIQSPLYVVYACPLIMPVSAPVYILSSAPALMLLYLPSVSVIDSIATAISLPSEVPTLVD